MMERVGLPVKVHAEVSRERIVERIGADKKARGGRPRVILLKRLGEVDSGHDWSHELPEGILGEVFGAVLAAS